MSTCRVARSAQLLLLGCCLRLCTGLDNTEAESTGLKYKLPTSAQTASILVRPSDTTTVNGTSPRTSLPQLATCGCPAADQEGKAPGASVVTAMQNLTAATTWAVEQTIFLSGQDVFHTEVGHYGNIQKLSSKVVLCLLMVLQLASMSGKHRHVHLLWIKFDNGLVTILQLPQG